jgi:hypothetical protein
MRLVAERATWLFLLLPIWLAAPFAATSAEVELRFTPADPVVGAGESARLAIWIDEPLELRTVEAWVTYDPAVAISVDGEPGQLFTDPGVFLWEDFVQEAPGLWYGYAIVMATGVWVTGPGELYMWHFQGGQEGMTSVDADSIALYDHWGYLMPNVTLRSTTITIGDLSDVPGAEPGIQALQLAPNPFNPRTELIYRLPVAGPVWISVFDARGREIDLVRRWSPAGDNHWVWEGKDRHGNPLASGIYLFRIQDSRGFQTMTKGVLVR